MNELSTTYAPESQPNLGAWFVRACAIVALTAFVVTGCEVGIDPPSRSPDTTWVTNRIIGLDTTFSRDSIVVFDTVHVTITSDGRSWDSTSVVRRGLPRALRGYATVFARTPKGKTERKPIAMDREEWAVHLATDDSPRYMRLHTILPLALKFPVREFGEHKLDVLQIQVPEIELAPKRPIELREDPSDGENKKGAYLRYDGRHFVTGTSDVKGSFVIDSIDARRRSINALFRGIFNQPGGNINDAVVIEVVFQLDY